MKALLPKVFEKKSIELAVVPTLCDTYIGKDGIALHKGNAYVDLTFLEELLDKRERLNVLIHHLNRDLGLGLDKVSLAHQFAKGGGWDSIMVSQAYLYERFHKKGHLLKATHRKATKST